MPILYGAVAYQEGEDQFESEKQSWDLAKHAVVIGCPAGCPIQYDLYTEMNATQDQINEYIGLILKRLENECPGHAHRIRIDSEG